MFLTAEELAILTGRKLKRLQIEALRKKGIPFFVNACGNPVVTRVAIEGRKNEREPTTKPAWHPNVLQPSNTTQPNRQDHLVKKKRKPSP